MPQVSNQERDSGGSSVGVKTCAPGSEGEDLDLERKLQQELPEGERRAALIDFVERRGNEQQVCQLWMESLRISYPQKDFKLKEEILVKLLHFVKVNLNEDSNIDLNVDDGSLTKQLLIIANDLQKGNERIQLTILLLRDALLRSLRSKGVGPLTLFHLDASIIGPAIQRTIQLFSAGVKMEYLYTVEDFFPTNRITAAIIMDSNNSVLVDEIKSVCESNNADWRLLPFPLPFPVSSDLDSDDEDLTFFYKADLIIIDVSVETQRQTAFYQIGIRESYGQTEHILLWNAVKTTCINKDAIDLDLPNTNMTCIVYNAEGEMEQFKEELQTHVKQVHAKFVNSQEGHFVDLLRKARETLPEKQHSNLLQKITEKLWQEKKEEENQEILTPNTILNLLLSFRETQDYEAMIKLVDKFKNRSHTDLNDGKAKVKKRLSFEDLKKNPFLIYLYAFALNRRHQGNDREKALELIREFVPLEKSSESIENPDDRALDFTCLCGRIYKDKFIDSNYTDVSSLNEAIQWYRRAYQLPRLDPNEIAVSGINLMTLLVVSGVTFASSNSGGQEQELQSVGLTLNYLIGKKGKLSSLRNYWDVATIFELSVLTENWLQAREALEIMFNLKPTHWCIKSTLRNLKLIQNKAGEMFSINSSHNVTSTNNSQVSNSIHSFVDDLEEFLKD